MRDRKAKTDAHRRNAPRLRLALDATFIGYDGRQHVTLLNLSKTGAQIALSEPTPERAGFVKWMNYETFGDVMWQRGLFVGLKFDIPIPDRWLLETRDKAAYVKEYEHTALREAAMAWVEGSV